MTFYKNEISKYLDECLDYETPNSVYTGNFKNDFNKHYFVGPLKRSPNVWAFRMPGMTKGSVTVDANMIVQKIEINDDYGYDIYKNKDPHLFEKELTEKFNGSEFIIESIKHT